MGKNTPPPAPSRKGRGNRTETPQTKRAARSERPQFVFQSAYARCGAATMQNSIGMESIVLMRENMPAVRAAFAFWSAGRSGNALAMLSARCWLGQITNQTLNQDR